jgi:hypothetical protein
MKASIGDQALFWGTIGSFLVTGIGFTAWITHVDYVAVGTASAQERIQVDTTSKFETLFSKLDEINGRLSHIEGKLEKGR